MAYMSDIVMTFFAPARPACSAVMSSLAWRRSAGTIPNYALPDLPSSRSSSEIVASSRERASVRLTMMFACSRPQSRRKALNATSE